MELKRTNHPQINAVLDLFVAEKHPFVKVHRMIDLFETIIKTHTALMISDYFRINRVSDDIKSLLAEGLITPSLGIWQLFSRLIIEDLTIPKTIPEKPFIELQSKLSTQKRHQIDSCYEQIGNEYRLKNPLEKNERKSLKEIFIKAEFQYSEKLFLDGFFEYFYQWDQLVSQPMKTGTTRLPDLINFRNKYAHGATPDEQTCEEDLELYTPLLKKLLEAEWLTNTKMVILADGEPFDLNDPASKLAANHHTFQPYLQNKQGELLNLFPIMTFKFLNVRQGSVPTLLFLNDLKKIKKKQISLLNYPFSFHLTDEEIYDDFISILNVMDWKKRKSHEFQSYIEELTESFQGRSSELEKISDFIQTQNSGFLFLFGNPGIGKSALIAKMIRDYKYQSVPSEPKTKPVMIEFFIRRNSNAGVERFLDSLNQQLEAEFLTRIPLGSTIDEKYGFLHDRLAMISTKTNRKVVICIDGLDEGFRSGLTRYLVTQSFANILFIYTSRPVEAIEDMYHKIPAMEKQKFLLSGLSSEEIRGLLYQVTNKYELLDSPDYVEKVLEKSEGNPLYLKLLCYEIENNHYTIDHSIKLPGKIENFYDEMLYRLRKGPLGNEVLQTLFVFAKAKDYLSTKQLEIILNYNSSVADEVLSILQEVLVEEADERFRYQLFHESLREYLELTKKDQLTEAELLIVSYCEKWQDLSPYSQNVRHYPMKYFSTHLVSLRDRKRLRLLAADELYRDAQIRWTNQHHHSIQLFLHAMELEEETADLMDNAIRIAELHNHASKNIYTILNLSGGIASLENSLLNISKYKGVEQFLLYVILLHKTVYTPGFDPAQQQEQLQLILDHLDEHSDLNVIGFKWCDFVSVRYMVKLMLDLKKLDCSIEPLLTRADLQNFDNEVLEDELADVPLEDPDCFYIVEKLFLLNPYYPVVKSFPVLLAKRGLFEKAAEICDSILNQEIKIEARAAVAEQIASFGKSTEALEMLTDCISMAESIAGDFLKVTALCAIALRFKAVGEGITAQSLFEKAQLMTAGIADVRDRSYAWRELAVYESKQQHFDQALEIIDTHVKDTWNQMIALCQVMDVMKEDVDALVKKAFVILDQSNGYRDLRSSVRTLAMTLSRLGRYEQAFEVYQRAKDLWNSLFILRSLGAELSRANRQTELEGFLQRLPELHNKSLLIGTFVSEKVKSGFDPNLIDFYENVLIQEKTRKIGMGDFETLNVQSSGQVIPYGKTMTYEECLRLKQEWQQHPDQSTKTIQLAQIATALHKLGHEKEAQETMELAADFAKEIDNAYNRSFAYSEAAREYSKQGKLEQALLLKEKIEFIWNVTALMRQIAIDISSTGELEVLFELIKEQTEKNSTLVMVDAMVSTVDPEHLSSVFQFIQDEVTSEVVKSHAYHQMLSVMLNHHDDTLALLKEIIPSQAYDRILISKCLLIYAKQLKSSPDGKGKQCQEQLKKLAQVIDFPFDPEQETSYPYEGRGVWLPEIKDEDDQLFIRSLIKQVERKKISPKQFEEMVKEFLE